MSSELFMAGEPAVRIETGVVRAEITALSWDTEVTGREQTSLLRQDAAVGLRVCVGGQWHHGADLLRARRPVLARIPRTPAAGERGV